MTTFLFWNLNRKPLEAVVSRLAQRHEVDVVMLVECVTSPAELLTSINPPATGDYHYVPQIACTKVELLTKFPVSFIPPVFETDRLTIRHLQLPGQVDILLAVNHFPSKLHWDDASQAAESALLASDIRTIEQRVGNTRTVVVGDLNMNPFDNGMVQANGLHAVMSRQVAASGSRIVQEREYPFFFNPMWSLFGDATVGPPGTYFYRDAQHRVFFWNMFDQVLIRPSLLNHFRAQDVQILDTDGEILFLSPQGVPDKRVVSDHLPILFTLAL